MPAYPIEEFTQINLAVGDIWNRGRFVHYKDLPPILRAEASGQNAAVKEIYTSAFWFRKEDLDAYLKNNNNSFKRFKGPHYSPFIYIDIDDKDLDSALAQARQIVEGLASKWDIPVKQMRYYFSGNKGFHIELRSAWAKARPAEDFGQTCSRFVRALTEGGTIDEGIYDITRLFRYQGSVNKKSYLKLVKNDKGQVRYEPLPDAVPLFKIPLTYNELFMLKAEEIKELAKTRRNVKYDAPETEPIDRLVKLWQTSQNELRQPKKPKPAITPSSYSKELVPPGMKHCVFRILREGFLREGGGERSDGMMVVIDYAKRYLGLDKTMAADFCLGFLSNKVWNGDGDAPDSEWVLQKIEEYYENDAPYNYGCNNRIMRARCVESSICKYWRTSTEEKPEDHLLSIGEMAKKYKDFIKNYPDRALTMGFPSLDEKINRIIPGQCVQIMARTSVGKCVAWDTPIIDAETGELVTVERYFQKGLRGGKTPVVTLEKDWQQSLTQPSAFINDGVKPVYRVRTRLGREVKTTLSHPFLTLEGWKPLSELKVGEAIGTPKKVAIFGQDTTEDALVILTAYLLGDGGLTQTTPRLTIASPAILEEVQRCAEKLKLRLSPDFQEGKTPSYRLCFNKQDGQRGFAPNPLSRMLRKLGLWGKLSAQKEIPQAVYRLNERQLALFLNRLFATDGSAFVLADRNTPRISYCSASKPLAQGVQHLLLRFGINAQLREKAVKYNGGYREAWEVELRTAQDILLFCEKIGIYSKEEALGRVYKIARSRKHQDINSDLIPLGIWDSILDEKGSRSWADLSRLINKPSNWNWWPYKRRLTKDRLRTLGEKLGRADWVRLADANIYWDDVISIDYVGEEQVYDFTVEDTHNFVAADIYLHNTAFALNIARNIQKNHNNPPTIFFTLEQPFEEIFERVAAQDETIGMEGNRQVEREFMEEKSTAQMIVDKMGVELKNLVFCDKDGLTLDQMKDFVELAKRKFGFTEIPVIFIDYIGRMNGKGRDEYSILSEIAKSVKRLAKDLNCVVFFLHQTSRREGGAGDIELNIASGRGSGQVEEASDFIIALYRSNMEEERKLGTRVYEVTATLEKNRRGGSVGVPVKFLFEGPKYLFRDITAENKQAEAERRAQGSEGEEEIFTLDEETQVILPEPAAITPRPAPSGSEAFGVRVIQTNNTNTVVIPELLSKAPKSRAVVDKLSKEEDNVSSDISAEEGKRRDRPPKPVEKKDEPKEKPREKAVPGSSRRNPRRVTSLEIETGEVFEASPGEGSSEDPGVEVITSLSEA
jgi:replicative DNA helicase